MSLYGLWAGLGAAPLRFWDLDGADLNGMNMAGGGHGSAGGPSPEEFRRRTAEFIEKHRQADGSVFVGSSADGQSMAGMEMARTTDSGGASMANATDHSGHQMTGASEVPALHAGGSQPPDVYVLAQQYSFEPDLLRLKANQTYRFRMMAIDAAHGASVQLGSASHIIRLPGGALVERELTFIKPGEYLVYCTMYCGEGHQFMSAQIAVS